MSAPKCKSCGKKVGEGGWLVCLRPNDGADWLCGKQACEDKYNDGGAPRGKRQRVLEVTNGVPIVAKGKPQTREGELIEMDGAVWRVERSREAGMDVRAVFGRGVGRTATWSSSAAGLKRVTEEELEARKRAAAERKVDDKDEYACENCWPKFAPGEDITDKDQMGRDPHCKDHILPEEEVKKALEPRKKRAQESEADVARVLALRAKGMKYSDIESEMGWPDQHGNRAWKIVKASGSDPAGKTRSKKSEPEVEPDELSRAVKTKKWGKK